MISGYLDSSVLLRILLKEKNPLHLSAYKFLYSSRIIKTECIRVLQRFLLSAKIDEVTYQKLFEKLENFLTSLYLVEINEAVLETSESRLPAIIGTLDSLHLSTVILLQKELNKKLIFLTHNIQLAKATLSMGIEVKGT